VPELSWKHPARSPFADKLVDQTGVTWAGTWREADAWKACVRNPYAGDTFTHLSSVDRETLMRLARATALLVS
jgi:hypothetical protein